MDDAAALLNMFPFEMDAIFSELKLESPQTVITSRKDTPDLQRLTCKLRQNFVTIVTSPLEVAIKAGITMVSFMCVLQNCVYCCSCGLVQ